MINKIINMLQPNQQKTYRITSQYLDVGIHLSEQDFWQYICDNVDIEKKNHFFARERVMHNWNI